jgi:hypothetical protein
MTGPGGDEPPRRSGLRDPVAAVRAVGAAALVAEALVLLLAIQPLRVLGAHVTGVAVGFVIALAVAAIVLAGLLRRGWAWWAGALVPVCLFVGGFVFHAALGVLGVLFGLLWLYVLSVRRRVLH